MGRGLRAPPQCPVHEHRIDSASRPELEQALGRAQEPLERWLGFVPPWGFLVSTACLGEIAAPVTAAAPAAKLEARRSAQAVFSRC